MDRIQESIEYTKGLIASMKNRGREYWLDNKNIESFYSLEEVCAINPKKPKLKENIEVSFIDMATLPIYGYKFSHSLIRPIAEVRKGYTYFEENDILIAKITPCFENGKCGIATNLKNGIGFGPTEFIVLRPKKDILIEYIYIFISSKHFTDEGKNFMTGTAGQQRISIDFIKNYKIPIISIEEQQKIIQEIEIEYNLLKEICNLLKKQETKLNTMFKSLFT